MVDFLPPGSDDRFKGLKSAVENVLAGGAQAPTWIAVDDGTPAWIGLAARYPLVERARGILAAATDESLVAALQLGIGGALRMPPSTPGVEAAVMAAESTSVAEELSDPSLLACLAARDQEPIVVSLKNTKFWRTQMGEASLVALLKELALDLDALFAIVSWPALVVADCEQQDVIDAWESLVARKELWTEGVEVRRFDTAAAGLPNGVYQELSGTENSCEGSSGRQPIHELPSGRLVGWWATSVRSVPTEKWLAVPDSFDGRLISWTLHGAPEPATVAETLTSEEVRDAGDVVALRIPGWATRDLRPGTPAGLLVAGLAESAVRSKLPLWIPNIDAEGLRMALCLPGTLWVDGPAVPR